MTRDRIDSEMELVGLRNGFRCLARIQKDSGVRGGLTLIYNVLFFLYFPFFFSFFFLVDEGMVDPNYH